MKILITGTSKGIGKATTLKFLNEGHQVIGIDIEAQTINHKNYIHHVANIFNKETLPSINEIEILINNAGIQTGTEQDIQVNLLGTMYVTEKYAFQEKIKSVLFNSSVSSLTGNEFPSYVASKANMPVNSAGS